jgi:hypothetical protein
VSTVVDWLSRFSTDDGDNLQRNISIAHRTAFDDEDSRSKVAAEQSPNVYSTET